MTRGGGEKKKATQKTTASFHRFLFLNLTLSSRSVKAVLFFLLLSRPRRGQRERERAKDTHKHCNRYKSSPPYRGQHTDKRVSTPHPTDPSLKTSETHGGRCGNIRVCVCNWQIDGSIRSHYCKSVKPESYRVELGAFSGRADCRGMIINKV